ncbi:MAG: hypothetical protein IKQ97_00235 [Eubacterium sp.]|nr:hypothetical protein [Eubacterium sp.]
MFGYVVVNKPELKIREFAEYKGYYCGLCHMLREKYGLSAGLTLTYDMTFLIVLLDSLYEPSRETKKRHCPIHPVRKVPMIRNSITEYAADMNILLSHGHLRDNWEDERRVSGLMGDLCFRRRARFCIEKYPRQAKAVTDSLKKLSNIEKTYMYHWTESEMGEEWRMKLGGDVNAGLTADIDEISRPFGELMSELFVWKEDAFAPTMRRFGFFLGKYIYIRDALDDLEKDRKNKCFNPFLHEKTDDAFRSRIQAMLDVILRQAIAEFEKLPLERNLAILRNILYEGVRREKTPTKADRLDKSRTVG